MKKITPALAAAVLSSLSGSLAGAAPSVSTFNGNAAGGTWRIWDPWGPTFHWPPRPDPIWRLPLLVSSVTDPVISPAPIAVGFQFNGMQNYGTTSLETDLGLASLTLDGVLLAAQSPEMPLNELGEFDPEGTTVVLTAGILSWDFPAGFPGGPSGMIDFSMNPLTLTVPAGQPLGVWNESMLTIDYNFMASADLFLGNPENSYSFMLTFMDSVIVPAPGSALLLLATFGFARRRR